MKIEEHSEVGQSFKLVRFRLRHLLALTLILACVLFAFQFAFRQIDQTLDLYYGEMAVRHGTMSREQAREQFGPIADTWTGPPKPAEIR